MVYSIHPWSGLKTPNQTRAMETLYQTLQERTIEEGCEMESQKLEDSTLMSRLFIEFFIFYFLPPCK